MANLMAQNPWVVDTAGAGLIATGRVRPFTIRWVGATTAGHKCVVKDAAGEVKWEDVASGANYVTEGRIEIDWNGVAVTTLDSGKLYIEHG